MLIQSVRSKAEGLARLTMVRTLSKVLPLYIVTEYPKSGGSWFSQMLAETLEVPFPRNHFPKLESCVMQGHYLKSNGMNNVFVVMRDGRDAMVSFYYFSLFKTDRFNDRLVDITRNDLKFEAYDDIEKNLPRFIEYKFNHKKHPAFTWSDFINSWVGDNNVTFIKYENLLINPKEEMTNAVKKICQITPEEKKLNEITQKYLFKNQAQRNPGEENKNSFLRKGIAGDWVNVFSQEAKEIFNEYAGDELIKAGYETDKSWSSV